MKKEITTCDICQKQMGSNSGQHLRLMAEPVPNDYRKEPVPLVLSRTKENSRGDDVCENCLLDVTCAAAARISQNTGTAFKDLEREPITRKEVERIRCVPGQKIDPQPNTLPQDGYLKAFQQMVALYEATSGHDTTNMEDFSRGGWQEKLRSARERAYAALRFYDANVKPPEAPE